MLGMVAHVCNTWEAGTGDQELRASLGYRVSPEAVGVPLGYLVSSRSVWAT